MNVLKLSVLKQQKVQALRVACGVLVLASVGCMPAASTGEARGKDIYQTCVPCHGENGQGNPSIAAPSIAGMEPWYIEAQLKKFRAGQRGTHADDAEGMRMRPMALSLPHEEDIAAVASYVTTLPPKETLPTVKGGDAARGAELFARCTACHGATGGGNKILNAPSLVGKESWYILTQLRKFRHGIRGGNPADANGTIMRAQISTLPDEEALLDLTAHIQRLAAP